MSGLEIMEPSACTWCGIARRSHGRQYADAAGWHGWEQPSQEQILARMKARRLQLAVAKAGALPMPMGGERTLDVVGEELTAANQAFWNVVQAYGRLRLALASAQRGRRALRVRVAELECPAIERHRSEVRGSYQQLAAQAREDSDYEGEAVVLRQLAEREALWAREDELAREFAADPLAVKPYVPGRSVGESADKLTRLMAPTQALRADVPLRTPGLRELVAGQREVAEGEHYAATHHDYLKGRDLPETGGDGRG